MKDSIANVWLLGIIMVFILLFSAYIAVTVDYSQTFKLKNEVLNIIEKHKGITNSSGNPNTDSVINPGKKIVSNVGTLQTINLYLAGNAYTAKGPCPDDGDYWYGVSSIDADSSSVLGTVTTKEIKGKSNEEFYYCFAKYNTGKKNVNTGDSIYYKVRLFYKMEFPVLSDFFEVKVEGITDEIYRPVSEGNPAPYKNNGDLYNYS